MLTDILSACVSAHGTKCSILKDSTKADDALAFAEAFIALHLLSRGQPTLATPMSFDVPSLGTIVAHFHPRVVIFLSCGRIFGQLRKVVEKTAGRQLVLEAGSKERQQISDRGSGMAQLFSRSFSGKLSDTARTHV